MDPKDSIVAVDSHVYAHTLNNAWLSILEKLLRCPTQQSRNGDTRELIGLTLTLTDAKQNVVFNPVRKFSASYAAGETLWYLSGTNDGEFIKQFAPSYDRFLQKDGTAHGAYGYRIQREFSGVNQLADVVDLLRADPDTRQAVISLWDPFEDLCTPLDRRETESSEQIRDIPCTLSLQFLIRGGQLHCVTTMRSNDVWLGLPYDVFAFTTIQRLIAQQLGVETGCYFHRVGSMHLYAKNEEKAILALQAPETYPDRHYARFAQPLTSLRLMLGEHVLRTTKAVMEATTTHEVRSIIGRTPSLMNALYVLASHKHLEHDSEFLRSYGAGWAEAVQ